MRCCHRAEGEADAALRAEEVRDDGVAAALYVPEYDGGAAALDDASVNFRKLKMRVNFGRDFDQIFFAPEQFEERAEVSMHPAASKSQRGEKSKRD